MSGIWEWITLLSAVLTGGATIAMLATFRRERRIGVGSILLSVALSIAGLLLYVLLSGARTSWIAAAAALALGLAIGSVQGWTTRLAWRDGQVVGRNSWLFLLAWGGSYAVAHALNLLGSSLLSSSGLLLLCLATGTQVGVGANILIRRLLLTPAPAAATGAAPPPPPKGAAPAPRSQLPPAATPPPPTLPERG